MFYFCFREPNIDSFTKIIKETTYYKTIMEHVLFSFFRKFVNPATKMIDWKTMISTKRFFTIITFKKKILNFT